MRNSIVLFFLALSVCVLGSDENGEIEKIDSLAYKAYEYQYEKPDSSLFLAREVIRLSRFLEHPRGMSYGYLRLGSLHNMKGNNDSSIYYLQKALDIRVLQRDTLGIIGALTELSYPYRELGRVDSSQKVLILAMKLAEEIGDKTRKVNVLIELSNLNIEYKDFGLAENYAQNALEESRFIGDSNLITKSLITLGYLAFETQEYKSALEYFDAGRELADSMNNIQDLIRLSNNMALCLQELGRLPEAAQEYQVAKSLALELGWMDEVSRIDLNRGILFKDMNNLDSAILLLSGAKDHYHRKKDYVSEDKATFNLSESYRRMGKMNKAYQLLVYSMQLQDSIYDAEKVAAVSEMKTKYETEKKEQQIKLLDQQNETKKAQRNALLAGTTVLVLMLLALGVLYISRQRINRKQKELDTERITSLLKEQEIKTNNAMIQGQDEERQRIAADLHDRLGGMLSTIKLMFSGLEDKIDLAREESKTQYTKTTELVDEAVGEVRRIAHNMNTGMVASQGLLVGLEELCDRINQSGKIQCKFLQYGEIKRLESPMAIDIYRMTQEVFNNILKHANATVITLQINYLEDSINLTVEDNGVGFNPENIESSGMGLANLKQRASKWNGDYHIDSTAGKGSISIIEIPIPSES